VFSRRGDRTVLVEQYAEPPYRVGRSFEEGLGLHLILASSAPGVFGDDVLHQRIRVERGAVARLTSQSALQAHPSVPAGTAVLVSRYDVQAGGTLVCEWHPAIPFPDARLRQRIEVRLEGDARLVWSDAWLAGRLARGEAWSFAEMDYEMAVRRDGRLEYLERYTLEPGTRPVRGGWVAGEAGYFGTVLSSGPVHDGPGMARLHARLAGHGAADSLEPTLAIVRLAAADGARFHDLRRLAVESLAVAAAAWDRDNFVGSGGRVNEKVG
jgi:urease accessory protein UreH